MKTTESTQSPQVKLVADRPIIVFFDGVCGFCNASVNFLLNRDRNARLTFAPLQEETAREQLLPDDLAGLSSLVILRQGKVYRRSAAVVRVLWELGGIWGLLGTLLWLIPRPLRDLGYSFLARNRYRIRGKKETCRLPRPEERARFLP